MKALRQKARGYEAGIGISPKQRQREKEREEMRAVFAELFLEEIRTPAAYPVLREVVERVLIEREAKAKQEVARRKKEREK